LTNYDYDAVIVGSGPNGLAAAITMQQQGLSVLLIEGKDTIGGGLRTSELTLPGFKHDVCSAIHPLAVSSTFFKSLPLAQYGLEFIYSPYAAAHPLDEGTAGVLQNSLSDTAAGLGGDAEAYQKLLQPLLKIWPDILPDVLAPLQWPAEPFKLASFGLKAFRSAESIAKQIFKTEQAQALWAGMAAHSMQPLNKPVTAAVALVLLLAAHDKGWPIPKGGSQQIADALAAHFISLGGKIETGNMITSLGQLPSSKTVLFDVGPRQLLQIAGHSLSSIYKWQLNRYKYGMGVYKVDWALAEPIPFTADACKQAGTVHIGGTYAEVAASELAAWRGKVSDKPFALLAQQSLFDSTRAPVGKHVAWGYCHTANGSAVNMTDAIEKQVERFAPGFRERILAKHVMDARQMEAYNPNYFGGDINGGIQNIAQLFTRPALRLSPYRTSAKGLYICSASTPPGGGVHGMCGHHAAKRALKDIFKVS
jgi:phytoene dehydrogenase-like protein